MASYNRAEEIEKIAKRFAVLLLVLAGVFLTNSIGTIMGDALDPYIKYIQVPLAVIILAIAIPAVMASFRLKRSGSYDIFEEGGYIGAMFQRAAAKAFIFTYAITVILAALNNKVLSHLSSESLAYIVLTYSLTAFSIAFFVFTRDKGETEADSQEYES